jgi:hypothetical protein
MTLLPLELPEGFDRRGSSPEEALIESSSAIFELQKRLSLDILAS